MIIWILLIAMLIAFAIAIGLKVAFVIAIAVIGFIIVIAASGLTYMLDVARKDAERWNEEDKRAQ